MEEYIQHLKPKLTFEEKIKRHSGKLELIRTLIGVALLTINAIYVYHQIFCK